MDIEPLLAHREDKSYKPDYMVQRYNRESVRAGQEVELTEMGQASSSRHNRIQDVAEYNWSLSNSVIKLNIQEILQLKDTFKRLARLSPEDQCISKQTFLHYFPLDGMLGQRLFGLFDKDKDERINAGEFLSGISLCLRGTMTDKCNLLFHMFDLDEDQGVSQDEMYKMLKPTLKAADSLSQRAGRGIGNEENEDFSDTAKLLVHEAFEECDMNQTGRLSLQNFQSWLGGHKELVRAVFNYPFQSVLKKPQDNSFGKESFVESGSTQKYEEFEAKEKRNSRLHPQTWMDEFNETGSTFGRDVTVKLENSKYLWSPLFAQSSSKFPPSRSKHAAILYHGYIYVFGGRGKVSTLKDLWRYSLADNTWDHVKGQSGTLPPTLEAHSAVLFKNQAYIFGGAFANDQTTPFWSYDFETSTWKEISQRKFQKEPLNRRGHTAVKYRDSMFIFGGVLDTGVATNEIWRYNFTSLRWHLLPPREGTELITPRHSHSSVVHNNSIWVFGGTDSKGRKNDLWTWDFELFTWTRVRQKGGPLPLARHTATKIGSLMIIFGGESNNELHNDTWTFSFDSSQWKKITPLSSITPTHRFDHTTIALNPYSAHLGSFRPSTTKSAPDPHRTGLRNNNPGHQQFPRTGSVDSILDYHEKRLHKGKSLDLSFELDNGGYDKSLPDISNDDDSPRLLQGDNTEGVNVIEVQPVSETSLQCDDDISTYASNDWSIVVIGGKGKHSTDLYKTSIDIWKCDIGPEVGSLYLNEAKSAAAPPVRRNEGRAARRHTRTEVGREALERSNREFVKRRQFLEAKDRNAISNPKDHDRLIITDLTTEESEIVSSDMDSGYLL